MVWMFHHGVRWGLHGVPTGQLGRFNILVFLHYDWRDSAAIRFLEGPREDQVIGTRGG